MPRTVPALTADAREKLRPPLDTFVAAGDTGQLAAVRVLLSASVSDSDRWMLRSAGLEVPTRGTAPRELDAELPAADLADLAAMPVVLAIEPRGAPVGAEATARMSPDAPFDDLPDQPPTPLPAPDAASIVGSPTAGVVQLLPADGWVAVFADDGPDAGTRSAPLVCWALVRGADGLGAVHGMIPEGSSVVPAPTVARFLSYRAPDRS